MSKIPISMISPLAESHLYNGQAAQAGLLTKQANCVFGRPVLIASQAWDKTNAPTILASTWAAAGDKTGPSRTTTAKIRADVPVWLDGKTYYGNGLSTAVNVVAKVVIWNSSAGNTTLTGFRLYSGDPTDAATKWAIETTETFNLAPGQILNRRITGTIHPASRDSGAVTDLDPNLIYIDALAIKAGTAPKLLFCSVCLQPIQGVDDSAAEAIPPTTINQCIGTGWTGYLAALLAANRAANCTVAGSLQPINQSAAGSNGILNNMYTLSRVYHIFKPATYDSVSVNLGGIWVPTAGQWTLCSNGKYRVTLRLGWWLYSTPGVTIEHSPIWFAAKSISGTVLEKWSASYSAATGVWVKRDIVLEHSAAISGICVVPRSARTSGSNNVTHNVYNNLFSCKAIPYED